MATAARHRPRRSSLSQYSLPRRPTFGGSLRRSENYPPSGNALCTPVLDPRLLGRHVRVGPRGAHTMSRSRSDHIAFVKRRALDFLEESQVTNAWLSFQREFPLHPDCRLTNEQIAQGNV